MRASRALRAAAAATGLCLALAACGASQGSLSSPSPAAAPVTVLHGATALDAAVAAVIERDLDRRGHPVTLRAVGAEGVDGGAVSGDTVAVVDTLHLALAADPHAALPAPEADATPDSTPTPAESLEPIDPAAPPRVPADPSVTAVPPPPLPRGSAAADADDAAALVDVALARVAAGGPLVAPASASPSAPSASDDAPRVLATSAGELRLAALVTATTAARLELDSLDDLNGRCGALTAAAPGELLDGAALKPARTLLHRRLAVLAGCTPAQWLASDAAPTAALVADQAQVALAYPTDPEVDPSGLVVLADDARVLPAGRIAAVGDPEGLDDDAQDAVREVLGALDEDGLTELSRITTGVDALSPEDAAQYFLVTHGLEDAPEGWVVPQDSWF